MTSRRSIVLDVPGDDRVMTSVRSLLQLHWAGEDLRCHGVPIFFMERTPQMGYEVRYFSSDEALSAWFASGRLATENVVCAHYLPTSTARW